MEKFLQKSTEKFRVGFLEKPSDENLGIVSKEVHGIVYKPINKRFFSKNIWENPLSNLKKVFLNEKKNVSISGEVFNGIQGGITG